MSIRVKQKIRPIGTTVILSCLIWIYADQINSGALNEQVTIQVASQSGSHLILELHEPAAGQFQVTFSGPRADLDTLRRDLGTGKFRPVYYVQPEEVSPGEDFLVKDSAEIINAVLRKDYKTIAVREVKPAQTKIFIDRLITVTMPVRVLTGTTRTNPPVVTPREVRVTLSRTIYNNLFDNEKFIDVNIESDLRTRLEDRAIEEDFALPQMVAGQPVSTHPTRVNIQLRIQRRFSSREFDIGPIETLGPGDLLARYEVEIRDPQIKVFLTGPAEIIDNLRPESIIAYIRLNREDMDREWTTPFPRDVQFFLPEGVRLDIERMARRPSVLFRLVEISAVQPAPR